MKLARKFLVPLLIAVAGVIAILVWHGVDVQSELLVARDTERLAEYHALFDVMLTKEQDKLLALALSAAHNPDIQQAMYYQDWAALLIQANPIFQVLQDDGISNFHFHLPGAISFLRVHQPDRFGDDLFALRPMLVDVNAKRLPISGVEAGTSGLVLRGVAPIRHEGEYVGSVEFGRKMNKAWLEEVVAQMEARSGERPKFEAALTLYVPEDIANEIMTSVDVSNTDGESALELEAPDGFQVYASTRLWQLPIEADLYQKVQRSGESITTQVANAGHIYTVMLAPLVDFSGMNVVAIVEVVHSQEDVLEQVAQYRNADILMGMVFALVLLLGLSFYLFQVILKPLNVIHERALRFAQGDLNPISGLETGDEFQDLARAFNDIVAYVRDLVNTLEQQVRERTQDLAQHASYLEGATEVARAAVSILESERMMTQVVNLIRDRFDLYYVGLFLLDATGDWAVLQAGTGEPGRKMLQRGHRIRVGTGMIGWSIANARARIARDVSQDAVRLVTAELPDTRAEAALPLHSRGDVLGALTVQSEQVGVFDEDMITILQAMVDQIAVALDNARLFAETQGALEEARQAYGNITRQAWVDMVRAQGQLGYICETQSAGGGDSVSLSGPNVRPVTGVWSTEMLEAAYAGETVWDGEALLAVPLKLQDQVLGVVRLRKPEVAGAWTRREVTLMEAVVEQLQGSLDRARLYQDTQLSAAQARLVAEMSTHIRETLDLDTILRAAVREIGETLNIAEVEVRMGYEDLWRGRQTKGNELERPRGGFEESTEPTESEAADFASANGDSDDV